MPTNLGCPWGEACVKQTETWGSMLGGEQCSWGCQLTSPTQIPIGSPLALYVSSWFHLLRIILISVFKLHITNHTDISCARELSVSLALKRQIANGNLFKWNAYRESCIKWAARWHQWQMWQEKPGAERRPVGGWVGALWRMLPGEQEKQDGFPGGRGRGRKWQGYLASGRGSPEAFFISHHPGNQIVCICVSYPFTLQEKVLKITRATCLRA